MILYILTLLILSANALVSSLPSTSTVKSSTLNDKIYNITETLQKTIANTLKRFYFNSDEWVGNKIAFSEKDAIDVNLCTNQSAYSAIFSKIQISEDSAIEYNAFPKISCSFSNTLKIDIPFKAQRLIFSGTILLTDKKNSDLNAATNYKISFNDPSYLFIVKPKFSIGEHLANEYTEIDVHYENFNIEVTSNRLTSDRNLKTAMTKAISDITEEIRLYLKSSTEQKLTPIVQQSASLLPLFTACMHPKAEISRTLPSFSQHERDYYYVINSANEYIDDTIKLNLRSTKIKGLSNFLSLDLCYKDHNFSPLVTMEFNNLEGDTEWNYSENDVVGMTTYKPVRFTINHISITGNLAEYSIDKINVDITSLRIHLNSNDPAASLIGSILKKKLKKIIKSSLCESLQTTYKSLQN